MSGPAGPVVVLGLDGASWKLLQPLAARGRMPTLAGLLERGAWGTLRSTVPALTLPAWASLLTGKNPGNHGVYAFQRLAPDRYEGGGLANASDLRAPSFLEIAGHAGRRVGMVNVPPSYPIRPLPNGYVVSCMLTPPGERFTDPQSIEADLGPYRIDAPPLTGLSPSAPDYRPRALAYLAAIREQTTMRGAAIARLLVQHPTDAMVAVFYAPDRIQHFFWQLVDPDRPVEADPELTAAVYAVYTALDDALATVLAAAGPSATTILTSDHGFTHKPEQAVRVNRWLADEGLLRRHAFWKLRRRVVRKWFPDGLRRRWDTLDGLLVDRPATRAWSDALFTSTAGIWVHVRGRYPLGCVEPGAEYEAVRTQIVDGLGRLRDERGRSVFRQVARRESLYRGAFVAEAPDIVAVCEPAFGVVFDSLRRELRQRARFGPFEESGYTGVHDEDGIYLAAGPAIAARGRQATHPIEAIAPTVLHLLDLPIPEDMDAAPMTDLLDPDRVRRQPPVMGPAVGSVLDAHPAWRSEEDEARVADHLRALGYLE